MMSLKKKLKILKKVLEKEKIQDLLKELEELLHLMKKSLKKEEMLNQKIKILTRMLMEKKNKLMLRKNKRDRKSVV